MKGGTLLCLEELYHEVQKLHDIELLVKTLQFELKACANDHTAYPGGKSIQLGEWLK
jgi:hypothetical protein